MLKTVRGVRKRLRIKSGGMKCKHSHMNHILSKKSRGRKRYLRSPCYIHKSDQKEVLKMLGGVL